MALGTQNYSTCGLTRYGSVVTLRDEDVEFEDLASNSTQHQNQSSPPTIEHHAQDNHTQPSPIQNQTDEEVFPSTGTVSQLPQEQTHTFITSKSFFNGFPANLSLSGKQNKSWLRAAWISILHQVPPALLRQKLESLLATVADDHSENINRILEISQNYHASMNLDSMLEGENSKSLINENSFDDVTISLLEVLKYNSHVSRDNLEEVMNTLPPESETFRSCGNEIAHLRNLEHDLNEGFRCSLKNNYRESEK